jgi:hypothetical protein
MKGQVRQTAQLFEVEIIGMSQIQPGMAALRSIDERASGWCRAYSAAYKKRDYLPLRGQRWFCTNFPLNPDESIQAPEAGRTLEGDKVNVK